MSPKEQIKQAALQGNADFITALFDLEREAIIDTILLLQEAIDLIPDRAKQHELRQRFDSLVFDKTKKAEKLFTSLNIT